MSETTAKTSKRPSYNGWALGDNTVKCGTCGAKYVGSSRSRQCAPCAYKVHDILEGLLGDKEEVTISADMEELSEVPKGDLSLELTLFTKANHGSLVHPGSEGWTLKAPPKEKKALTISTTEVTKVLGTFRKGQFYETGKRSPMPGKLTNWWYATDHELQGGASGQGPTE